MLHRPTPGPALRLGRRSILFQGPATRRVAPHPLLPDRPLALWHPARHARTAGGSSATCTGALFTHVPLAPAPPSSPSPRAPHPNTHAAAPPASLRVENLYFSYLFVLRAAMKAAPILAAAHYDTGNPQEDARTQDLMRG